MYLMAVASAIRTAIQLLSSSLAIFPNKIKIKSICRSLSVYHTAVILKETNINTSLYKYSACALEIQIHILGSGRQAIMQ